MSRQDDIEELLRQVAPLFLNVSRSAQVAADSLRGTDWARVNLTRTASANQVAGTARRRIACDRLVDRRDELGGALEFTTTDPEHNQGRYYLRSMETAILLTVRRKPHERDEQPLSLQLQLEGMRELVAFEDEAVVYLEIPPLGQEPQFEITTRGQETIVHRLIDLISGDGEYGSGNTELTPVGPRPIPPRPSVTSTLMPGRDDSLESTEDDRS